MIKKVTIHVKSGGIFVIPLKEDEISKLIQIVNGRSSEIHSNDLFDINTLVDEDKKDINTEMWVRLDEIDCIQIGVVSNITVPEKEILTPGA